MIPTIETILEDLAAGRISTRQATAWLHQHVDGAESDLRDHFAGLAISGFSKGMVDYGWDDEVLNGHTTMAYRVADSMLAARSAR